MILKLVWPLLGYHRIAEVYYRTMVALLRNLQGLSPNY